MSKFQSVKELKKIKEKVEGWRSKTKEGHELSKTINEKLNKLDDSLQKFITENEVSSSKDKPADGLDLEKVKELQEELKELKDLIEEMKKSKDKEGGAIKGIDDDINKWHAYTEENSKKVESVTTKVFAVIGIIGVAGTGTYLVFKAGQTFFWKKK